MNNVTSLCFLERTSVQFLSLCYVVGVRLRAPLASPTPPSTCRRQEMIRIPAPKRHLGAPFNMPQIPCAQAVPSMCGVESTKNCVSIKASGNASGWIHYVSKLSRRDGRPRRRASYSRTAEAAILTIHNKSYVRIEGFEIRNFRTAEHRLTPLGISVMGAGSHIELLKNNVHHIEQTFNGRDASGTWCQRVWHCCIRYRRQDSDHVTW